MTTHRSSQVNDCLFQRDMKIEIWRICQKSTQDEEKHQVNEVIHHNPKSLVVHK